MKRGSTVQDAPQDKYERYHHELDKEDGLVNDRVNWLLLSQSILFAAIGFAGKGTAQVIYKVVPALGCALSVAIGLSIVAAICSICRFRKLMKENCSAKQYPPEEYPQLARRKGNIWARCDGNIWLGHIAALFMPPIFIGAWVYLIVTL